MGEITEMILDGVLCQCCGVYIEDDGGEGPRNCADCDNELGE